MYKQLAGIALATFLFGAVAEAAPVKCEPGVVNGRFVTVDPAKVGGLCKTQEGNIQQVEDGPGMNEIRNNLDPINTALIGAMALLLDKDGSVNGIANDTTEGLLKWSQVVGGDGDGRSGTWTVEDIAWDNNIRLFLGFHFGGGNDTPDSFLVELNRRDLSGLWSFTAVGFNDFAATKPKDPVKTNALSNIYLFGTKCTDADRCDDRPPTEVPAPGVLGLLAVGLLGLAARARRS